MRGTIGPQNRAVVAKRKARSKTMLDWWLVPLLAMLVVAVWTFYLIMKHQGGPGVRTEGRTLVDKPDDDLPPSE